MTNVNEPPRLDEAVWNAWVQKTKLRELRTARKMKISGAVILSIAAIAAAFYRLALA